MEVKNGGPFSTKRPLQMAPCSCFLPPAVCLEPSTFPRFACGAYKGGSTLYMLHAGDTWFRVEHGYFSGRCRHSLA